jgi:hypothetical protein
MIARVGRTLLSAAWDLDFELLAGQSALMLLQ